MVAAALTLSSSYPCPNNPPVYGDSVEFTATVSAPTPGYTVPTGVGETVDFYDETIGADLGPGTLSGGVYTVQTSALDAEDHYITATYTPASGSTFVSSTSDEFDQTVNQAATSTQVTVFDNTQGVSTTSPTYGDSLTFTATIGSAVSPAIATPSGGVEFYDGSTDLGAGTAGGAGQWSLTTTAPLAVGNHTIVAIYSGDDNFSSSASTDPGGSSASVSIVGQPLSFASLSGGGGVSEGSIASVSGTLSNLDAAAFSVNVVWGDGQSGDSDNGGQPFCFAAGTTSFTVSHYYNTVGTYTLDVTVTPTDTNDNRQVEDNTSVRVTASAVAPRVVLAVPPVPVGGLDPGSEYTVGATGYSPDGGTMNYQWTLPDGTVLSDQATVQLTGAQYGGTDVKVTDTDTGLATCVSLGDPSNVSGLVWNTDPSWLPTLTVTETDPGGMVFEGDVATFDVHAQWAGASWVTAGDGPWVPVVLPMTVYYDTIDPSGSAPADYQSTYGPRPVTLSVSFDGATDSWIADGTITVRTNGGIDDGVDGSVTVQLTHPFLCQLADNGQAMATIVHPDVTISSPGMPSGEFDVLSDVGTRTEVDVNAEIDSTYPGLAGTSLQLTLPQGETGLTFWTAESGGTQLVPDANGVLETLAMPSSGNYDGTLWVEDDAPATVQIDGSYSILAQMAPAAGPAVESDAVAAAGTWGRDIWWAQNAGGGQFTGQATAAGDATLYDLAKDILGNGNKWGDLFLNGSNSHVTLINAATGEVADGTKIDISPLLADLQGQIQSAIVAAASNPNLSLNCNFPTGTDLPTDTGPYALSQIQAAQINSLFQSPGPTSKPNYWCGGMAAIIYAEGAMKGAGLSDSEWDDLNIFPDSLACGQYLCPMQPNVPLNKLNPGDWVQFDNHSNCPNGWIVENAIVIEPTLHGVIDGSYFGWPTGARSYLEWINIMQKMYEKDTAWVLQDWGLPPMYQGKSYSINIPALAMMIFDMRATNKTPHGIGI